MDVDIERQCGLAIHALNSIVEIAGEAGIETSPDLSYDEWEHIVQAIFDSFVVMPICDTSVSHSGNEFHKLGFVPEVGKTAILFYRSGGEYFVFDLAVSSNGRIAIEAMAIPCNGEAVTDFVDISECSDFHLGKIC